MQILPVTFLDEQVIWNLLRAALFHKLYTTVYKPAEGFHGLLDSGLLCSIYVQSNDLLYEWVHHAWNVNWN